MSVQRYDSVLISRGYENYSADMEEDNDGDWVLYEDHATEITRLRAENERLRAENERLRAR